MERLHLNISSTDKPEKRNCQQQHCKNTVTPIRLPLGFWYPRFCKACALKESDAENQREEIKKNNERIQRLNLPPRFAGATFKNFEEKLQPTAMATALAFASGYSKETTRGLYLFGHAGSGKTHLAAAIGNYLVKEDVRFVTAPELLISIKKGFTEISDDGLLDKLSQTKLLIIDDLGSEKPTEWVQETLFVLIDRRYTHYLPTIITSNYSLDQLKDRLGYRIASRIAEISEMVELRAIDYRVRRQQK